MAGTPTPSHPGRLLAVIAAVVVALLAWMVVTGTHTPKLGLDLQGGTSVTLIPKPAAGGGTITSEQISQAREIISQRVNGLGVAEAEVTVQGQGANASIVVSIPGASISDVADKVGQTAQLNFRPVLQEAAGIPAATPSPSPSASSSKTPKASASPKPSKSATPSPSSSPAASPSPSASQEESGTAKGKQATDPADLQAAFDALDCSDPVNTSGFQDDPNKALITCSTDGSTKYLLDKAPVLGNQITDAGAVLNTASGLSEWAVNIAFNSDGTKAFADTTRALYANQSNPPTDQFGIVLDGLVISAPRVNEPILDGKPQITGSFTQEQATTLANQLKYGALPLAFEVGEVQQISPTLGTDQLHAGLLAGMLGLLLVALYSLLYYRGLGLVTIASLAVAGVLTYSSIVFLGVRVGFTLTLAGIAGTIVAIGITADSFVVYFERIRDEVREGRSLRSGVESGWIRARRTILAADAVSMIASVVLYVVSVGAVRGFAFTLGLTTLIDVFVVFFFTKPLVTILSHMKFFASGHPLSGVDPKRLGRKPAAATATTAPKEA
jgi:preprotein translocase subunit SecD